MTAANKTTRQAEPAAAPLVSVVIASCREQRLLDACLESLEPQCRKQRAEIVVARNCNENEIDALRKRSPFARFVAAPGSTIPQLRAAGMAATKGDMVALTEDHCIACADWLRQLTNAFQNGTDVIGGAMDNAQRKRSVDWAAYFAEYGFFAANRDGRSLRPLLTAANVAYGREVAKEVIAWARKGEWENVIHDHLFAQGRLARFVRTATVCQNKNYRFWDFCYDRFVHGRDYARRRLADGARLRWLYFAGSPVLPLLLTTRVAWIAGTQYRRPFFRALPITFAFLAAWTFGEAIGYWHGPARLDTGRS